MKINVCSHVHRHGIALVFCLFNFPIETNSNCLYFCLSISLFYPVFPFDTGMIAGYILNRYKSAPPAITPFINVVLWMMSLGVLLLLVFGVWNGTLNLLWTALYVSLGHSGENIIF